MPRLIAPLVAGLFVLSPAFAADPLDGFDEAVNRAIKLHAVPGVGIAIVKDGKVVLAKGYGVREKGKAEPVTENTLFAIGSVSKSFTAALAALYVDEGKLRWDARIQDHIRTFEMRDAYRTREVRLRDCLGHRVGLDRYDMVWYGANIQRDALLSKLPQMKPSYEFRTNFVYNNILYLAAGEAIAKVGGKSWDDLIAEKLFSPLGMASANTNIAKLPKDGDVATPHERKKGVPGKVAWLNADPIGPAGSINASAADMAKYVLFQLTRGKTGDKRLLKAAIFEEMHKPQMIVPKGAGLGGLFNPDSKSSAYGLGWFLGDYAGRTLVEHGGNVDGMTAQVGFLPEEKIGVVVLANLGQSALPAAILFDTFDRYLGRDVTTERVDGTSLLMWMAAAGTQVAGVHFDESKRRKDAKPPVPLANFDGKYEDALYSPVEIKTVDGKQKLTWTNFPYELEYWQYATFRGVDPTSRWPNIGVHFTLDENGKPIELRLKGLNVDDVRFKRK
jgi:CubicO group peptidase (beta-lactamase class C family)